jgi:diacylglycerol kinase family enzyme
VANANHLFNNPNGILKLCKSQSTAAAIWYAGIESLLSYKNFECQVSSRTRDLKTQISNLGVLIKPNFSGDFCYDFDVGSQSGYLGVAICENHGLVSRLRTIRSLAKNKFSGLPGTQIWKTTSLEIKPARIVPLEFDGEVVMVREVRIKLLKKEIRVCA